MTARPRILVGTLYSGENEFPECSQRIADQVECEVDHRVFEGLSNKEAHSALYRLFMANADRFELFAKVDADMVLMDDKSLSRAARFCDPANEVDQVTLAVRDWYSDAPTMGLHVFSNRAVWPLDLDPLFVDPNPEIPGRHLQIWEAPAPIAWHSPDPSPLQAFAFGVHRGMKTVQPGRRVLHISKRSTQLGLLKRVWQHFLRASDRRLGLAVLGADVVFRGELVPSENAYKQSAVAEVLATYEEFDAGQLREFLTPRWGDDRELARVVKRGSAVRALLGRGHRFMSRVGRAAQSLNRWGR